MVPVLANTVYGTNNQGLQNGTTNSGQFNLAGRSISKPEIYKKFFTFYRVRLVFLDQDPDSESGFTDQIEFCKAAPSSNLGSAPQWRPST
jgi:hypothetical protein